MILCLAAYIIGSLVTFKKPFNLDRLLHRGIYNTDNEKKEEFKWSLKNAFKKIIGITPEFSKGDKIITWSVFIYSFVYRFFFTFVVVVIWNIFSPWKPEWWGTYFFVLFLGVPLLGATVSLFWFVIGGIKDMRCLFHDLSTRKDDPLDNGVVEGHVSIADAAVFAAKEKQQKSK